VRLFVIPAAWRIPTQPASLLPGRRGSVVAAHHGRVDTSDEIAESLQGSMTAVTRIGATVHRPTGRWTPAVHALLDYLAAVGFDGAPRPLGFDDEGREVLTYLPGDPVWPKGDQVVIAVGRLIRRLHDALEGFESRPGCVWRVPPEGAEPHQMGHNDLTVENTVFVDGVPSGFIDWDLAGPAPPLHDLAWAAVNFVPLRPDGFCSHAGFAELPDRPRRLRLFCEAYGVEDPDAVLGAIDDFLDSTLQRICERGSSGVSPFATFLANGEDEYLGLDLAWFRANRQALTAALRSGR
jgi:hypothetical protein